MIQRKHTHGQTDGQTIYRAACEFKTKKLHAFSSELNKGKKLAANVKDSNGHFKGGKRIEYQENIRETKWDVKRRL